MRNKVLHKRTGKSRHMEEYFRNLIVWNRNHIVFNIFRLILKHTDVRLVTYQSKNGKYNLISVWFNKISRRFPWVYQCFPWSTHPSFESPWNPSTHHSTRVLRGLSEYHNIEGLKADHDSLYNLSQNSKYNSKSK